MKKGTARVLGVFGMRLILTTVSCIIMRWGMVEKETSVEAGVVEDDEIQNLDWVAELDAAKKTNQLIVVEVDGTNASLSMYEKVDGTWIEYIETEAYIGKKGIGKVREGDGKTPIGEFQFTKAFGILENPGTSLDYVQVDESYYWVDDEESVYYNQLASTDYVKMDWESAEHICEYEGVYNYVLAINYNENCVPGMGSAIFLHCTSQKMKNTSGCIAVSERDMIEILREIDKDCILIIDTENGVRNY